MSCKWRYCFCALDKESAVESFQRLTIKSRSNLSSDKNWVGPKLDLLVRYVMWQRTTKVSYGRNWKQIEVRFGKGARQLNENIMIQTIFLPNTALLEEFFIIVECNLWDILSMSNNLVQYIFSDNEFDFYIQLNFYN